MLDLTLRLLVRMLSFWTPSPRGRHRLGAPPPLRFTPIPPARFTELLAGNASCLVRPYLLGPDTRHSQIVVDPRRIHGVRVPAATR
jgi:hypothetical protein